MYKKILVIGAGAWGTAIANTLSKKNNNVYLWARDLKLSNQINKKKINKKYYKNFKLSRKLKSNQVILMLVNIIIFSIFYLPLHLIIFPMII